MPRTPALLVALPSLLLALIAFAPTALAQDEVSAPRVSIAFERVGGVSYTKAYAKDTDNAASITAFGIGGVNVNPYTAPRLGIDYLLDGGLTLGGGLSVGRFSLSTKTVNGSTTTTQDTGSLFIYTLTPRVGYRIPVSPSVDITPRGGLTLAGGSVSSGGSNADSAGVFALALSGEGVLAYRATRSFNFLFGAGIDYTITASASQTNANGTTSTSSDLKGGLFALQAWIGIGGYL
jgi:hypothetical protein